MKYGLASNGPAFFHTVARWIVNSIRGGEKDNRVLGLLRSVLLAVQSNFQARRGENTF